LQHDGISTRRHRRQEAKPADTVYGGICIELPAFMLSGEIAVPRAHERLSEP
jgi:hypothetical protein